MPTPRVAVRPPANDDEIARLADVIYQSFAGFDQPFEVTTRWLKMVGREQLRVAVVNGQIAAGLGILEFGQYFGGRSVPAAGITCVGVAPDYRGLGVGAALMRSVMVALARAKTPLSVLYPSTYALYRKAGFEPAGVRMHYKIDLKTFGVQERELPIRTLDKSDRAAIRELYREIAPRFPGKIDRADRQWTRILESKVDRVYAYGVPRRADARKLDGYVVYHQTGARNAAYSIHLHDLCAANWGASRRLLTFLGDHMTMAGPVHVATGHAEPWLTMGREEWLDVEHRVLWMLRVLDLPAALEARGYSPGVSAELHLEVRDDLIKRNAGRFVVRVADGTASVKKGGGGRIRVDIRGLAPLYTGHFSAEQLVLTGLLDGDDNDLAAASAVFAGPAPGMGERF
jgi:predicted acetyltransferase